MSPSMTAAASALFVFFWASGFISAKYGFPFAEPFTFLCLRFLVAIVLLTIICFIWRVEWPKTPTELGHVVLAGWLVQATYLIGVWYGIWLGVDTGVVALIVGMQPILTGTLSGMFLGEKVTKIGWIGLVLGFVGLSLVVSEKVNIDGTQGLGALFCVVGLFGITIGTLYQKKYCGAVDTRAAVLVQNIASLALILPLAFLFETRDVIWEGEFWFALFWSSIGLSVVAIALYFVLVQRGAAVKVTSMIYLSPPTTAIMGWAVFGETMSALALLGFLATVVGVALAARG
ncbi:MAG: DMT family transporter [Rhodospirillaceae bacterium]